MRGERVFGAALFGELDLRWIEVHADHAAAGGAQELDADQADETETDHEYRVTQGNIGLTHAVHGDGADGSEGGFPRIDGGTHLGAEIFRDEHVLRMTGDTFTGAHDPIADGKGVQAVTDLDYPPDTAVAQRGQGVEPLLHFVIGFLEAVLADALQHLLDLVGARLGFFDEAHAGLIDLHFFGAGAHHGVFVAHQNTAGPAYWNGHLFQPQLAGAVILNDLFQRLILKLRGQLCRIGSGG